MELTSEQKVARIKKLVSSAKPVITGQIGIAAGAHAISTKLRLLGTEWESEYPIFGEFYSSIPADLPIGSERLHWNLDKVLELDEQLAKIELEYRQRLLKACVNIITIHG